MAWSDGILSTLLLLKVTGLTPLLDAAPIDLAAIKSGNISNSLRLAIEQLPLPARSIGAIGMENLPGFYELLTAPASKILNRWFESEPLLSTLATDAVIGANISPDTPGSSYVLLHHVFPSP